MYCFRRAAFRVLSSSATAAATPARPRPVTTAFNRSSLLFSRQSPPQCPLQRRWNSDEVRRQTQVELENEIEKKDDEEHSGGENATVAEDKEPAEEVEVELNASPIPPKAEMEGEGEGQVEGKVELNTATTSPEETPEAPGVNNVPEANTTAEAPNKTPYPAATPKFRYVGQEITPKETVYIANLYYDITPDDLRTQMEKFGAVENVTLVLDSKGLSKGFGYVTFESIESATAAIETMHRQVYEGRPVLVQYARNNTVRHKLRRMPIMSPSRTLYIGKIPPEMTAAELHELFDVMWNVIDVRVSVDRRTGQLRGFAHAEFLDIESAKAGFEYLSPKVLYGKHLRLDYSHTNKKVSGPGDQGSAYYEAPVFNGPSSPAS